MVLRDAARVNMLSAHARLRVLTWSVVIAVNADLGAPLFLSAREKRRSSRLLALASGACSGVRDAKNDPER